MSLDFIFSTPALWLALAVILGLVEMSTVQMVVIWFAVGAIAAMFAALFHLPFLVQLLVFAAVSVAALVVTRPLVKTVLNSRKQATNADLNIGKIAIVTEEINNDQSSGRVQLSGLSWSARSLTGEVIAVGERVRVDAINGVKLMVTHVTEIEEEKSWVEL